MVRTFALGAYGFQSLAAVATILAAGAILPASEYGAYSIAFATNQAIAVFIFEWLRIAGSRFAGSAGNPAGPERLSTISLAFLGGAALALLTLPIVGLLQPGINFSALGALAVIFTGFGDLHVTLVRYRGDLLRASFLQIVRSILIFAGVIAGAVAGSAETTFFGLVAGSGCAALVVGAADRRALGGSLRKGSWKEFGLLFRYGAPSAIASTLHLLIPVSLRWIIAGSMDAARFGGIALALDLLQRPFVIALTALNGVLFPAAIHEHDRQAAGPRRNLDLLYRAHILAGAVTLGAGLALYGDVAAVLIERDLRAGFLTAAPPAVIFFAFHAWLQNTIATGAMLAGRSWLLVRNAAIEIGLAGVAVAGASAVLGGEAILPGAAVAAAVAAFICLPLSRQVPVPPLLSVSIAAAIAFALIASLHFLPVASAPLGLTIKAVMILFVAAAAMNEVAGRKPIAKLMRRGPLKGP